MERYKTQEDEVKLIKRHFLTSSWWVVLFIFCSLSYHFYGVQKRKKTYDYLQTRLEELESQKKYAENYQEELVLEISSQKDPAWIEMLLMKGLGVVPEGSRKVYFTEE